HALVGEHRGDSFAAQALERLLRAGEDLDPKFLPVGALKDESVLRFVVDVDDERLNCVAHAAAPDCFLVAASGSSMRNAAPLGTSRRRKTPPWRSTIMRDMVRPRPVPLPGALVVKNGSKMRSRASLGTPGPLS